MYPNKLRIALVQCDIKDLSIAENLQTIEQAVELWAGRADLLVFPEAITTGFSKEAYQYAEPWGEGLVYDKLCSLSQQYGMGLCGSYFVRDNGATYNRFLLIDGAEVQYQDKRHLFSLGGEPDMVQACKERKVLHFRSWRIMPLVCYDLRFPVWSRCVGNDYDAIICVANWPRGRREVWKTLLKARAMENLAYIIGVNRVGQDKSNLQYLGDSVAYNPRGEALVSCAEGKAVSELVELDYQPLEELRRKFPVWQDADLFEIKV